MLQPVVVLYHQRQCFVVDIFNALGFYVLGDTFRVFIIISVNELYCLIVIYQCLLQDFQRKSFSFISIKIQSN